MSVEFEISELFSVSPQVIYDTWLDSAGHAAMAGHPAEASGEVGGEFMAGGGHIHGKNLELTPGKLIRQTWRATDFGESDTDSELEIALAPEGTGTRLTLKHTRLPDHGMKYRQGWVEHYFEPMNAQFGS